jgi:Sulfotransferase family
LGRPILITGMARSGGSWVSRMVAGSGEVVHINEPFNRRHPPGLTPGILHVPPPRAYQYVGVHNEAEHLAGFRDMLRLRYNVGAELRVNRGIYDLAKMAKYATAFSHGRLRGLLPLVDDPYMVFAAEWMAERLDCQVVMLVRHPAGIVSSLARIGTGWSDNLPDIAAQPELVRDLLAPYADELERAAREPLDPIVHGALLWRVVHAGIQRQVERNPRFVIVRYEDLAADPMTEFRALYRRLEGLTFNDAAEDAVNRGCLAGPALRQVPWGRVGFGRTAFQPMQSQANAWAWRDRLSAEQVADVLERTRDVAERFYTPAELEGEAAAVPAADPVPAPRPALVGRRRWRSA